MYSKLTALMEDWLGNGYLVFFGNNEKEADEILQQNALKGVKLTQVIIHPNGAERGLIGASYSERMSFAVDVLLRVDDEFAITEHIRNVMREKQSSNFNLPDDESFYSCYFSGLTNSNANIILNGEKYLVYSFTLEVYAHDGLLMSDTLELYIGDTKTDLNQLVGVMQFSDVSSLQVESKQTANNLIPDLIPTSLGKMYQLVLQPKINNQASILLFKAHQDRTLNNIRNKRNLYLSKSWWKYNAKDENGNDIQVPYLDETIKVKVLDSELNFVIGQPCTLTIKLQEIPE